ncbi:MAG: beta-eliminating lyase-related protein, partial [Jiangellaceae bacterium]
TRTWSDPRGRVDLDAVGSMLAPDAGPYLVSTAAVAVENTHNFAGGTVQPLADLRALRDLVDGTGVRLHLDGARLWNAHVASGTALAAYGELFDTASVCLSKGLGAPIGSVLVGPQEAIGQARQWRKRMGAGWRQAGVLAAAGNFALDRHVERLADDHANARTIAGLLAGAGVVDLDAVETNIVMLELTAVRIDARQLVEAARAEGVLAAAVGPQTVRLITHLDVTADDCRKAAETLARLLDA